MIFEDAHWSDPTSLEVLGRVVSRIATLRALLIVTFRPEFQPPWIGQPHVTAMTINRSHIVKLVHCSIAWSATLNYQPTSDRTSSSAPTAFPVCEEIKKLFLRPRVKAQCNGP